MQPRYLVIRDLCIYFTG